MNAKDLKKMLEAAGAAYKNHEADDFSFVGFMVEHLPDGSSNMTGTMFGDPARVAQALIEALDSVSQDLSREELQMIFDQHNNKTEEISRTTLN